MLNDDFAPWKRLSPHKYKLYNCLTSTIKTIKGKGA